MTEEQAKTGLKAFGQGRRDILMIAPSEIIIEPGFNARDFSTPDNQAHVEWLKASIIEQGLKEPLTVRLKDGKVVLVGGESRLRAILKAIEEGQEILTIPCQAEDRRTNDAERVAEIHVRNSGKPLTPLEQAALVRRLVSYGWDQAKIARRWGCSPSNISNLLGLLTMPEAAQEMVRQGDVSAATAAAAVRTQGETEGVDVLREAVTEQKAAGKKKASIGAVRRVAAKRETSMKPMGITLNSVKTEKVMTFLRSIIRATYCPPEIKAEADALITEIYK